MKETSLVEVRAIPWNVELTEPFGIATGAQHVAANVLVEVELADGTRGQGEAAPFPVVSGETQSLVLQAVAQVRDALLGLDATRVRPIAALLNDRIGATPSARAAIESALLDAVSRRAGVSLQRWFGGAEDAVHTDITIVTGTLEHATQSALRAMRDGFDTLKIKVGGAELEHDVARIRAIDRAAPGVRLILDANGSFTSEQALALIAALGDVNIALFEQPVAAGDLDGMRAVRSRGGVRVAADESARGPADIARLLRAEAADVINIKVMKSGLVAACDMIAAARACGFGLMIGAMVETPLAVMVSACLAAGQGGFEFVDLDTPLFLRNPPVRGFVQHGPRIDLSQIGAGHGIEAFAYNR